MANFNKYFPRLIKFEGGFGNDPDDAGGATNFGVILTEWIAKGYDKDGDGDIDVNDLKLITQEDAAKIAKTYYWDKLKGDLINSQSIAEIIVDFAYNSGVGTASRKLQKILGVTQDGIIGNITIGKLNSSDYLSVFNTIKATRKQYYLDIVANKPSQKKFLKGWMNRLNDFTFHD